MPTPLATTARPAAPDTRWVLFAFIAPHAIISWLIGLLSMVCWIAHRPRFEGAGILTLEFREWFASGRDGRGPWNYSTTIIRTLFWNPGAARRSEGELDERVERHERVHVRQSEDLAFAGFLLGLAVAASMWTLGWYADAWQPAAVWLGVWLVSPLLLIGNWITALLRFGIAPPREGRSWLGRVFDVAYRDSEHERSAYAQTDTWPDGQSWWHRRERGR